MSIVKRKKLKWNNILLIIICIFFTILAIISLFKIIFWYIDNKNINKNIDKINSDAVITTKKDNDNTEIINNDENKNENDPYWSFIKLNLIDVDFSELKKTNSDTVGWIQVQGTNINYPFVQTSNNSYYLSHAFDKSKNDAGWVFADYRNNILKLDKNTILYAHGRINKTMFGDLKTALTNGWLDNLDNYIVRLSTETENTLWQVFSVYRIPTTNDYLAINFNTTEEFSNFTTMLLNRSEHDFKTSINDKDYILTLSTCYNNNEKVVMHAKLIKKEAK